MFFSAPEESICDTIDHSNLRGILRDLCYWQSHVTTVEELTGKVTSADWYPLLLDKLAESVVVISGAPNVGKSSLAVHLAKTLGLTRTKTTSKHFWLFARNKRPYFSLWVYCTDSFWSEDEPAWPRMRQSIICYLERRIQYRSSDSRRSSNFCFSRLCRSGHHCCLPGGYGQTFD